MLSFLRKNWIWIVLPLAVVAAGAALLVLLGDGAEVAPPFDYNVM